MDFLTQYGPWAVITGASEGTGASFALQLAAKGMNLVLVARREGPLDALAEQIRAKGVECVTAPVDLTAPDAADRIIAAVGDREVGLLIANAGADTNGSLFLNADIAQWEALVNMNVYVAMRLVHHLARPMRARGRGGIMLVGSGACYGGLNGISVYSAAKGFLLNFGEGLWAELRHDGVHVLNMILGRTDTPAHRRLMERNGQAIPDDMAQPDDVARVGLERLPHGPVHNWGQEEDIAGYAPNSPAERRAKIVAIEKMSGAYAGEKEEADA